MNGYSSIDVKVDIRDTYFITEDASNPKLAAASILLSRPWSSFPIIHEMLYTGFAFCMFSCDVPTACL